eukprot:15364616-Ditylum_brightwellii.AAC.2
MAPMTPTPMYYCSPGLDSLQNRVVGNLWHILKNPLGQWHTCLPSHGELKIQTPEAKLLTSTLNLGTLPVGLVSNSH